MITENTDLLAEMEEHISGLNSCVLPNDRIKMEYHRASVQYIAHLLSQLQETAKKNVVNDPTLG